MKIYEIIDEELCISVGVLLYYGKKKEFIIELQENLDEWTAPLLFTNIVGKKIFTVPRDLSFMWVKERIIPSGRQNISAILKNHKMECYDEMKFLEISKGKCSQDGMYIRKIDEFPDYVTERRKKNLTDCVVSEGHRILCFFKDNVVKRVDLSKLEGIKGVSKILKNDNLYRSCQVGTDGYYITFNDSIDIASRILYERGDVVPVTRDDFLCFAKNNLLDTSECCQMLECSRQNIAYMVKQEQLVPIKEGTKGNLYLREDVEKYTW